jgi:hypothetical protein
MTRPTRESAGTRVRMDVVVADGINRAFAASNIKEDSTCPSGDRNPSIG